MSPLAKDYADCRFLPLRLLEKAIEPINSSVTPREDYAHRCKQNLRTLQQRKVTHCRKQSWTYGWAQLYSYAIRKAVYSHNWDQLLHLMRASPVWEHHWWGRYHSGNCNDFDIYYKAYIILLTHHPEAKRQGLLQEYLHMVQSCRSDDDKKAMMKILATLPDKLISRNSHARHTSGLVKEKKS